MTNKKATLIIILNLIIFFYSAYNNISIKLGEKTFSKVKFFFINSVYNIKTNYLNVKNYFTDIDLLSKKVKVLKEKNNLLTVELNSLKKNSTNSNRFNFIPANVIASSFSNEEDSIFINAGVERGVCEGEGVVSKNGIVGIVVRAYFDYSKVLLITDIRFSTDVILEKQKIKGLLTGTGNGFCKVKYLPINTKFNVGENVVTSDFSGIFPLGYPVGKVIDVEKNNNLYKTCIVKPFIRKESLDEVFIIKR